MPYTGGKGRAYRHIVGLMPPHDTYIESHLGGGAVLRRKRPARRSIGIDLDERPLAAFKALGRGDVELVHADAVDFLSGFAFSGGELVYADPPYWPEARRRRRCYRHDYDAAAHHRLLDCLASLPCPVMLSGYRSDTYDARLAGWHRWDFRTVTQAGPVEESVWMNFQPDGVLHDYSYVGDDFREREALKRRRQTQIRRLAATRPLERRAILADLAREFPEDFRAAAQACDL